VEYRDNRSPDLDGSSDFELFFLPQVHLVSPDYSAFRFGFALTYPYGLAKSWDQPFPEVAARHFSLDVVEASPSLSYQLNDDFSLAAGIRAIYAKGEVRNTATNPPISAIAPLTTLDRDLEADDIAFGYNLALTFRPLPAWRLAATYRSQVDFNLEGDADLTALVTSFPVAGYHGSTDLDLTLPAVFSLATSYTFGDLTLEVAWNRTFWSDIDALDFNYDQSLAGPPFQVFDQPVAKDWKDSDALRFGLTYEFSKQFTTTLGFAIDNTPIPERTVNFDLPDADAYMYGLGVQYSANDAVKLGISYMYYHTASRSVTSSTTGIDGTFDDGGAHAITVGAITSF
jgi:long-chain fatty acid transport protein